MVNKVNKDNTLISGPSLAETAAGRKLHVITRTAVLQVLSESPNKQRKLQILLTKPYEFYIRISKDKEGNPTR